jgi:two-component system, cell cycle sensor histidine kinase and response regulator CckA
MVLVVDDESAVRGLVARALAARGFVPLEARNGIEAVELYASYRSHIVLVITDVEMPVMDGLEAIDRMRELSPGVRAVVMSGANRELDIPDCPFLPKPFTLAELMERVEQALAWPSLASPRPRAGGPGLVSPRGPLLPDGQGAPL